MYIYYVNPRIVLKLRGRDRDRYKLILTFRSNIKVVGKLTYSRIRKYRIPLIDHTCYIRYWNDGHKLEILKMISLFENKSTLIYPIFRLFIILMNKNMLSEVKPISEE